MLSLEEKTAIVTGAGRGIGRAIAVTLSKAGANLVAVDVDHLTSSSSQYQDHEIKGYQAALKLARELGSGDRRAIAVSADVTRNEEVVRMVEKTHEEFGSIDILVNNAGVVTQVSLTDLTEEQWDLVMNVNMKGVFLCCKAVAPYMMRNRSGKIVNVASDAAKTGQKYLAHYCASKFAVLGFTQSIALELAPYNINVNAVCPGYVYTKMWEYLTTDSDTNTDSKDKFQEVVRKAIPLGRPQTLEDIANTVLFLCLSDNITGESINVTGGCELH